MKAGFTPVSRIINSDRLILSSGPRRDSGMMPRRPGPHPAALLLSLLATGSLFGLMLLVSVAGERERPISDAIVLFSAIQTTAEESERPEEEPVEQREVIADSPEEAAPSSRLLTLAPAPALATVPPAAIELVQLEKPRVHISQESLTSLIGGKSRGSLAQGPPGTGGNSGDGVAGDGSGGSGSGNGSGSRLIASWAPSMDFSQNHRHYPQEARLAGIEGAVWLKCFVLRRDRVRDCQLVAESPLGHGFGEAALKTEKGLRVRVHNQAGRRVYNEWVVVETNFRPTNTNIRQADSETDVGASDGSIATP